MTVYQEGRNFSNWIMRERRGNAGSLIEKLQEQDPPAALVIVIKINK